MSFTARLSTDLVLVEAGSTVPATIEVTNRSAESDRYEMQVEGVDPEWVAAPEPVFSVEPGETRSEKVFFRPPRVSESIAGNYPFVLRIRSLTSGDSRTVQGVLQVKPFHHLSMEIGPKKGIASPVRSQNTFGVTIMNLGNTEHTLQLFGNDPEEALTYEFETEQVMLGPGQQKQVNVEVVPSTSAFLASSRLHGFSISARSIETPSVVASTQAQLEQRPVITPATFVFIILLGLLLAAWFAVRPKDPTIDVMVDRVEMFTGEQLRISWQASDANRVEITVDGQPVAGVDSKELDGAVYYTPSTDGPLSVEAIAYRDRKASPIDSATVTVNKKPITPDPVIRELSIKPSTVRLGETAIITYRFNEAVVRADLSPTNDELNLSVSEIEVKPTRAGTVSYTVSARNKDGKAVTKSVKVTVTDPSNVIIISPLSASPKSLEFGGGTVTLSWQLSQAERVELHDGIETQVVESSGSRQFFVDKTTTFRMTASDAFGKKVVQTVEVKVAPPPPDEVPPPTTSTTGTTGTPPPGSGATGTNG